jgi:hypothetical protein
MTIIYQKYLGEFTITASNNSLTFEENGSGSPHAISLTVGEYFMRGYTSEAVTGRLVEHLQALIRAVGAPFDDATVTLSDTTGKITIDWTANTDITSIDSGLRDLMGFEGVDVTDESIITGAAQARYIWMPGKPLAEYPGELTEGWLPRSLSRVVRSMDGTVYSIEGNKINDGFFSYAHLDNTEVITDSSTVWESLQQFWEDCIHTGRKIRFYPDRTANGSTNYYECLWVPPDMAEGESQKIGPFRDYGNPHTSNYRGYWDVDFSLIEYL